METVRFGTCFTFAVWFGRLRLSFPPISINVVNINICSSRSFDCYIRFNLHVVRCVSVAVTKVAEVILVFHRKVSQQNTNASGTVKRVISLCRCVRACTCVCVWYAYMSESAEWAVGRPFIMIASMIVQKSKLPPTSSRTSSGTST